MARAKTKPTPELLMKYRAVENIHPGAWWLGEYEEDDGKRVEMWTQVSVLMFGVLVASGRKIVRVHGTCTDGERAELLVCRGTQLLSLTERDGTRCGLTVDTGDENDG